MEELLAGPLAIIIGFFVMIFAFMMMGFVFMMIGTIMVFIMEIFVGIMMLFVGFITLIIEMIFLPVTVPGMIVSGLVNVLLTEKRTATRVAVVFIGTLLFTAAVVTGILYLITSDFAASIAIGGPIGAIAAAMNAFTSYLDYAHFKGRMRGHLVGRSKNNR